MECRCADPALAGRSLGTAAGGHKPRQCFAIIARLRGGPMRLLLSAFLLSTLIGSFATAQSTWIVDDTPGPGVNFTSLPAAVNAAASGDTLLVAPGNYQPFHAMNKSLTILGSG